MIEKNELENYSFLATFVNSSMNFSFLLFTFIYILYMHLYLRDYNRELKNRLLLLFH